MTEISSASLAHDLHTRYVEYRAGHPKMDRLIHLGYYRASRDSEKTLSALTRKDLDAEMEDSSVYNNVASALDDAILSRADTVFLTDDLRELVKTAEATMPDEVLFETDIYTPCGFIVMETPLKMDIMSRANAQDFDELVSATLKHGGSIYGERRHDTPDEYGDIIGVEHWNVQAFAWGDIKAIQPEAIREVGEKYGMDSEQYKFARYAYMHPTDDSGIYVRVYGTMTATTIDGLTLDVPELGKAPLRLMDMFGFFYGEEGLQLEHDVQGVDNSDDTHQMDFSSWQRSREVRRFLVALFRLMEEYVDVEKRGLHRAFGKRATRSGRIGDTKNVTILSLRRALGDDEEGSGTGAKVTLAHLVRGHWRNQWYPSHKMHRAKWIRAHRRGGNAGDEVTARPRIIKVDR